MDLATLTAAPSIVTVGGRDFKIGPLRFLEHGILQRWINENYPKPDDAQPGWKPPQVGVDLTWPEAVLSSPDGIVFFIATLFGKHQDLSDDDIGHILAHVGPAHMKHLWQVALDVREEESTGPKVQAAD